VRTTLYDEILQAAVTAELDWDSEVDAAHIGVSAKDGAVTLTGYVPSHADKVAAVQAAERVDGVNAVADDVAVQLRLPGKFTDAEIAEQIARRRNWNPEIPATIDAEVADGHVTLRGVVASSYQRKLAEDAVRNLLGVRDVANEISISARGLQTEPADGTE
jgi:osmotically-inducible protein OsmY